MLGGPGCMANPTGLPNTQIAVGCPGPAPLPPKIPGSIRAENHTPPPRPSSTDVLSEEVPSWFEDLLNEPDSPANKPHRRSASEPFAYLAVTGNIMNGPGWTVQAPHWPTFVNGPTRKPNQAHGRDRLRKSATSSGQLSNGIKDSEENADAPATEGQNQGDGSENSSGGSDSSQMKLPCAPRPDAKRKQHNARRSRVRKLQYIAELENNAHALQMEGAEVSAQLEFLDQQNMILAMENRALKQRLESLSQEHFVKSLEQELLDRELARLQYLYHLQNVKQHQQRQRQKQAAAHRRGRSCDIDSQFAKLHLHPPQPVPTSNGFKEPQRNR
ncbi:uncharacterized protein At4g06598-like [Silene latifolia]|uniref:uncharacterized protein At4g06598-like n=1 Tax=Silene latifolia TaxID=37657 RepID=UPI003D77CB14